MNVRHTLVIATIAVACRPASRGSTPPSPTTTPELDAPACAPADIGLVATRQGKLGCNHDELVCIGPPTLCGALASGCTAAPESVTRGTINGQDVDVRIALAEGGVFEHRVRSVEPPMSGGSTRIVVLPPYLILEQSYDDREHGMSCEDYDEDEEDEDEDEPTHEIYIGKDFASYQQRECVQVFELATMAPLARIDCGEWAIGHSPFEGADEIDEEATPATATACTPEGTPPVRHADWNALWRSGAVEQRASAPDNNCEEPKDCPILCHPDAPPASGHCVLQEVDQDLAFVVATATSTLRSAGLGADFESPENWADQVLVIALHPYLVVHVSAAGECHAGPSCTAFFDADDLTLVRSTCGG